MPRSVSGALRRQPAPSGWRLFSVEHPISAARAVPPARCSPPRSPAVTIPHPDVCPPLVIDTALMAELRAARAEDVGAIAAIDPQIPSRLVEIRALVREQASLVALDHGEIVGFLAVRPGHFYQRDFIDLLLVAPRYRRQGVGRALVRSALHNASTSRVFTSTNESNTPMRELLRSEGWHLSGVLTGLDEGDPEHVFFQDAPGGRP